MQNQAGRQSEKRKERKALEKRRKQVESKGHPILWKPFKKLDPEYDDVYNGNVKSKVSSILKPQGKIDSLNPNSILTKTHLDEESPKWQKAENVSQLESTPKVMNTLKHHSNNNLYRSSYNDNSTNIKPKKDKSSNALHDSPSTVSSTSFFQTISRLSTTAQPKPLTDHSRTSRNQASPKANFDGAYDSLKTEGLTSPQFQDVYEPIQQTNFEPITSVDHTSKQDVQQDKLIYYEKNDNLSGFMNESYHDPYPKLSSDYKTSTPSRFDSHDFFIDDTGTGSIHTHTPGSSHDISLSHNFHPRHHIHQSSPIPPPHASAHHNHISSHHISSHSLPHASSSSTILHHRHPPPPSAYVDMSPYARRQSKPEVSHRSISRSKERTPFRASSQPLLLSEASHHSNQKHKSLIGFSPSENTQKNPHFPERKNIRVSQPEHVTYKTKYNTFNDDTRKQETTWTTSGNSFEESRLESLLQNNMLLSNIPQDFVSCRTGDRGRSKWAYFQFQDYS